MRTLARALIPHMTVVLFAVVSVTPLLQRRMTCSDDGAFGIHKALGLELALELGDWFPRWSPHMAHGFGYPLYNFYAPLGSYLLAGLHGLGFIYPVAMHIAFGISIVLAGLAVYSLVKRWLGERAGVTSAVIYVTSPYLAFNILFRGALAETLALVWLPLILFTLDMAIRRRSPRSVAFAALCFAGLVYTHNATALLASPLILGYSFLLSWTRKSWNGLGRAAISILAGIMLSAHFWMPALSERGLVQTEQLLTPPIFTYYTNFLTAGELLAPPRAVLPHLLNPSPPKALGAIAAVLALIGSATLLRCLKSGDNRHTLSTNTNRSHLRYQAPLLAFFTITLLSYASLTMSYSRPLWDTLPLLPFVQFPWRMLGVATLCAAVLCGAATQWFERFNRPWLGTSAIAALAILGNLSWWYPRYCADFHQSNVGTMLQYEYDTFTIGTSAKGEFLPRTVRNIPEDNTLAEALMRGESPDRLRGLPSDATVNIRDSNPLDFRAHVRTGEFFTATYQMFYYLGWRVTLDGQPQPLQVAPDSGLIQFSVPPGEHDIHVFFGATRLRMLSSSLSVIALLGIVVLLTHPRQRPQHAVPRQEAHTPALLLAVPLGMLAAKLLLIDRTDNLFHRKSLVTESLGTPVHISLDNGLDTLAYAVRPDPVPSGDSFDVLLYLTPRHTPARDFRPIFRLQSSDGQIWNLNPHETLPPRWHREPPRTQYWPIGQYGQFARLYKVLPATPPGEYLLSATFFDYATLETSRILTPPSVPQTDRIDLGTLTVARPSTPPLHTELEMQFETRSRMTSEITLLGGSTDRRHANPGDLMSVTLFFQAEGSPSVDDQFTLGLAGTDFALRLEPTPGFPTTQWQPGDIWRGQHLIRLPADLVEGDHIWTVMGQTGLVAHVGSLHVTYPARVFDPPTVNHKTRIAFGADVLLSGYAWSPQHAHPDDVIEIKLVWKALRTPSQDLNAFVHLENKSGALVAQHDGVPAQWTRPSPGWLSGEYVSDIHSITVPEGAPGGEYYIYAGLADRASGARLPLVGANSEKSYESRALLGVLTVHP